jgi:hypothetical protein
MSVATFQPVLSVGLVKMDDSNRKRAAITTDPDDNGPPIKKQATFTNGAGSNDSADVPKFGMANSSWQVDLEVSGPRVPENVTEGGADNCRPFRLFRRMPSFDSSKSTGARNSNSNNA